MDKNVQIIINSLKSDDAKRKMYHQYIPVEYENNIDIIIAEREAGIRKIKKKGFDVINQYFFVYENVLCFNNIRKEDYWREKRSYYNDFKSYYDYLNGDIYDNACYYQWDLSGIKKGIDKSALFMRDHLISHCIDDYGLYPSDEEKRTFEDGEKRKKYIKEWSERFCNATSLEKIVSVVDEYEKTELKKIDNIRLDFFFWQYVFADIGDRQRFDVIMQYMSTGRFPENIMIKSLCHVYDPTEVMQSYNYSSGSKQTCYRHKKELKEYVESLNKETASNRNPEAFFDIKTHYFCERDNYGVYRYFENIEDFLTYRDYDLTGVDLSEAIDLNYDFSKCKIDENTKLPINVTDDYDYKIQKEYYNGKFWVKQKWYNKNGIVNKEYTHEFDFFFDFVAFLKGNLSGADLIQCDGLRNLSDISGIDFTDARVISEICDRFGIKYSKYNIEKDRIESFKGPRTNEKSTALVLQSSRELTAEDDVYGFGTTKERIYYISDLHIMHKTLECRSLSDVLHQIFFMVNTIVSESGSILLIGGDVSSDFAFYELFITTLKKEMDRRHRIIKVFFTLGNHELWSFEKIPFEEIVDKYRKLLKKNGMQLIQNEIVFQHSDYFWENITESEIMTLSSKDIREKLRNAQIVIFGGLAFSGCNEEFNALNGIYRGTISREEEIEESKKFNKLYKKIRETIPDKEVVVFTHTPLEHWNAEKDYHKNYVYINGHTHRNFFHDDGEIRIYADNQIGYTNKTPHLKWLVLDTEFDYFSDFEDGIHRIKKDEYIKFYRGKNITITYNRDAVNLYMLKKNGYYAFFHESMNGLSILNGGALKRVEVDDIRYYYDRMEKVITSLKGPLDKYTAVQEKVADEIKRIGGDGFIHGCIIDIDFYNHVYVNPIDMKITGYWASDMINKQVYSSVAALLKKECPVLYKKYSKLLQNKENKIPLLSDGVDLDISLLPKTYLETDIYKVSREINKLQKLKSNVLTMWIETDRDISLIEKRNDQ